MHASRSVCLVQLPIPPLGPEPIRANVPLAAGYLKLWAERQGLGTFYDIQVFPPQTANHLCDRDMVTALAERKPWMVGFSCYLWNIERTLWIARELKRIRPHVRIVLGGPEITADNSWVLDSPAYDFAVIGEGEQTFAHLLLGLAENEAVPPVPIAGLYVPSPSGPRFDPARRPAFRTPMPDLNALGSPYRAGILDVADEQMLLLETTRGCKFKCKFCYYPKAYDQLYYLTDNDVLAELRHAAERGAHEVVLLDPTLNQRKDFTDFLRLLIQGNPGQRFRYFGELRAEGITAETAALLRAANFTEVEVGLQSIEPDAMKQMDRKNNLRAFERGVRAMLNEGIKVKVDLIVGLPGDTADSVRRGMRYLRDGGLYSDIQVFHLAILPGTAFRAEASLLGLEYQTRPPYHVLRTPALHAGEIADLIQEAEELFEVEFDAPLPPALTVACNADVCGIWRLDLDAGAAETPAGPLAQAFTLWLRADDFGERRFEAAQVVRRLLHENPFTTLQVILDSNEQVDAAALTRSITLETAEFLLVACLDQPTYLDRCYALQRRTGAKRLVVLLPFEIRSQFPADWIEQLSEVATIVWRGCETAELEANEYAWADCVSNGVG
jgi:radical SAM superfamily enzyme YgiQ (UPF0313 family)